MTCSNKGCPNHSNDAKPVNRLGECEACHQKRVGSIRGSLNELPKMIVKWFEHAEQSYGTNTFYSADIERLMDTKNEKKLQDLGLGEMKFGARLKLANNGTADSFLSTAKNFKLMATIKPSAGIRSFILGRLTVCECEGMMKAVIFNALCDLVGDEVFDAVFADLEISGSGWGIEKAFINEQVKSVGESDCNVGDWTFIAHTKESAIMFRELALKNKTGGSASGTSRRSAARRSARPATPTRRAWSRTWRRGSTASTRRRRTGCCWRRATAASGSPSSS